MSGDETLNKTGARIIVIGTVIVGALALVGYYIYLTSDQSLYCNCIKDFEGMNKKWDNWDGCQKVIDAYEAKHPEINYKVSPETWCHIGRGDSS